MYRGLASLLIGSMWLAFAIGWRAKIVSPWGIKFPRRDGDGWSLYRPPRSDLDPWLLTLIRHGPLLLGCAGSALILVGVLQVILAIALWWRDAGGRSNRSPPEDVSPVRCFDCLRQGRGDARSGQTVPW